MTITAEIAYYIYPTVAFIVIFSGSMSLLNFMIKRARDNDMEVKVTLLDNRN